VEKLITTAENLKEPGKDHAYHIISKENRDYLKALPAHIKLEFQLKTGLLNLVFAHGSTRRIDEYVLEDTDENYVLELIEEAGANVLSCNAISLYFCFTSSLSCSSVFITL